MAVGTRIGFDPEFPPNRGGASTLSALAENLQEAIDRGVNYLLSLQARKAIGWASSKPIQPSNPTTFSTCTSSARPIRGRIAKLANYVRRRQLPDGGWNIYFGGPSELNATVKAYVALKLAGDAPECAAHAARCRRVHELGGLEATNSYTRFYLALVGAVGWDMVPAVPPELMLLPNWFAINIYEMSSWTRGIVIPLTILYAHKPRFNVPGGDRRGRTVSAIPRARLSAFDWEQGALQLAEFLPGAGPRPEIVRAPALEAACGSARCGRRRSGCSSTWSAAKGWRAIYPAMMNAIFALVALGHSPDDPLTAREIDELARFEIEEGDTIRVQPCVSPVWDTAIAMVALEEAGLPPDHPALVEAADWLLDNQILRSGRLDGEDSRRHAGRLGV